MLLVLQILTGTLLAFYYVPSADTAHITVAYIEKALPAGSWMRAMHHFGSQWLTLFLVLHLIQMFWRASYRQRPVAWMATILLLALVLLGGVTGYSLPWDARAFFGTNVADGIASGLPLIGDFVHRWLAGGAEVSTATLSRFFGIHVLVVPALVFLLIAARLSVFHDPASVVVDEEKHATWKRQQFTRQSMTAGLVFLALALYAMRHHAPLGPAANDVNAGYLPRPGAQFLWLFQMLKYLPGSLASLVGTLVPGLIFLGLGSIPFFDARRKRKNGGVYPRRKLHFGLFALGFLLIAFMTTKAYLNDMRDPKVRAELQQQAADEEEFRARPFEPLPPRVSVTSSGMSMPMNSGSMPNNMRSADSPPEAFQKRCASCHGTRGQGVKPFPKLLGVSTKPRRTVDDIIGLLDDPKAFGLEPPMRSFATKLSDAEKRDIAEWLMLLKKP
jgi:ubiquinol-cytochrome c reductase cytochrome b subunit